MELSIFIAKLYGVTFLAMGIGLFINPKYYMKAFNEMTKSTGFMLLGGFLSLVLGTVIVTVHNIWEASWVVIITFFGWMGLLKGILLIVFPKSATMFESWFANKSFVMVMATGTTILGAVLCYYGFFV